MTVVYRHFGGSTHVRIDTFAELKEAVSRCSPSTP